jgi:hypothetical protein
VVISRQSARWRLHTGMPLAVPESSGRECATAGTGASYWTYLCAGGTLAAVEPPHAA